jgi:hypothetical protein
MFENSPREFTLGDAEGRAFLSAVAPYIVAVLLPGGDVGTGTLVRWKSVGLVLTANHNLEGTKRSEVRFCFYPGGSLRDGPMTAEDRGDLYRGVLVPVGDEIIGDRPNDIVAIPLNLEHLPGAAKFYEIDHRASTINDGATVVLAGFAGDNSFPLPKDSRAVGVTVQTGKFDTTLNSRKFLSSSYRAADHLLPYSRVEEGIRPHGISGAAAWCNGDCPGDVWAARPLLVGVQTSWFPRPKLLQIVRLGPVLSLLERL